jgi:hypothetical protein
MIKVLRKKHHRFDINKFILGGVCMSMKKKLKKKLKNIWLVEAFAKPKDHSVLAVNGNLPDYFTRNNLVDFVKNDGELSSVQLLKENINEKKKAIEEKKKAVNDWCCSSSHPCSGSCSSYVRSVDGRSRCAYCQRI